MGEVRHSRRGRTRISRKNQAAIPVDALRRAGLKPGDELAVEAAGAGRITLARADVDIEELIKRHAGKGPRLPAGLPRRAAQRVALAAGPAAALVVLDASAAIASGRASN